MPALEQQGDILRATLERHRRQHSTYPATLAETGLVEAAWTTPFGPWHYARADTVQMVPTECRGPYALSLGEYDRDDFEVCWDWPRQAWAWNQ